MQLFFPAKTDVGGDNSLEWTFKYSGSNNVILEVTYTDETTDEHIEYSTGSSYETVIYELDDNKIVDYVYLWNYQWWAGGHLWVDYMAVDY
ncbi:MAG: hypothetical protein ACTSV5_14740 [Promethearchaeota archaeon]